MVVNGVVIPGSDREPGAKGKGKEKEESRGDEKRGGEDKE